MYVYNAQSLNHSSHYSVIHSQRSVEGCPEKHASDNGVLILRFGRLIRLGRSLIQARVGGEEHSQPCCDLKHRQQSQQGKEDGENQDGSVFGEICLAVEEEHDFRPVPESQERPDDAVSEEGKGEGEGPSLQ